MPPSPKLRFGLLGPLAVVRDGRPVRLVGKPAILLVALLLRRNQVVPVDRLLDELWDEHAPKSARKLLQAYVSQLRKSLGSERLQTFPAGYLLAVADDELDLARFQQLVRDASRTHNTELFDEALDLWRGPALADIRREPFAEAAAGRLEDLRLHAVEDRVDAMLDRGEHHGLVPELEGIVNEHPLREQLRGQLMLALYRSGRQADALASFREGRELLVRTLGLEPGPSLRRLHEAILQQDASLEAPLPPASTAALVVAGDADALDLFAPVARRRGQELLLVRAVSDIAGLDRAVAELEAQRALLVSRGLQARIAAFRSDAVGRDLARLCERSDADLAIIGIEDDATPALESLAPLLQRPPCDVALLVADRPGTSGGPVVVAFGGGDNDWAALELGVALAQAHDTPLVLAGGSRNGADSSRALAAASLAVQRVASVVARPVVVPSGSAGLRAAAEGSTALLLGLPDDWRERGVGRARAALLASPPAPTALVRRGLHVGTLGAEESVTQFTWSR